VINSPDVIRVKEVNKNPAMLLIVVRSTPGYELLGQ